MLAADLDFLRSQTAVVHYPGSVKRHLASFDSDPLSLQPIRMPRPLSPEEKGRLEPLSDSEHMVVLHCT